MMWSGARASRVYLVLAVLVGLSAARAPAESFNSDVRPAFGPEGQALPDQGASDAAPVRPAGGAPAGGTGPSGAAWWGSQGAQWPDLKVFSVPPKDLTPALVVGQTEAVLVVGFGVVLVASLLRRFLAFAAPLQLFRSRFYELPPARGMIHLWKHVLLIAFLAVLATAARSGYKLYEFYDAHKEVDALLIVWLAATLVSAFVLYRLVLWHHRSWVTLDSEPPTGVRLRVKNVIQGIPRALLAALGQERFPNRIGDAWKWGLWARALLTLGLLTVAGVTVWAMIDDAPASLIHPYYLGALDSLADARVWLSDQAPPFAYAAAAYIAVMLLGITLFSNRNYLLLPFGRAQVLLLLLSAIILAAVLVLGEPRAPVPVLAVLCGVWAVRLAADLRLAATYGRKQRVYAPLSEALHHCCDFLPDVPEDPACSLPPLDPDALAHRITRGAKNLEEASTFVTRNFGRYMRLARVHHEPCAVAMLRFLTVRRYMGLSSGWSTHLPLCHPPVPVWDEQLFPIHAPNGYVNRTDPLTLGAEWNVVAYCERCGGSGTVLETETYTEYEYYSDSQGQSQSRAVTRTRQVVRTCPVCGGSGKLEHNQILYTQWQRLLPAAVHPHIPMPELIEDAEEVIHFHAPFTAARRRLPNAGDPGQEGGLGPRLARQIEDAMGEVRTLHDKHAAEVVRLHDGVLYRSDFVVAGFHTINIRFGGLFSGLGRRLGWFFGRRPEFYFPRLPLSWSMVGTYVFLPPFALLVWCLSVAGGAALLMTP